MGATFNAPVLPGDTIRTEIWADGTTFLMRARAVERDVMVVRHGRATVH